MTRAIVLAIGLVFACGGSGPTPQPLQLHAEDQRLTIAAVEVRGASDAHRAAVTAIAREHLAIGAVLTEERRTTAHKRILDHYYEVGHVNVAVVWPELAQAKGPTPIVLTIDEGPVFTLDKLDVKDVSDADRARYLALATIQPGEPFQRSKLAAWMQAVSEAAPGKPIVVPETSVDLERNTVSMTLVLARP